MFGERCLGLSGCGHQLNWTCPCTCDEEIAADRHVSAPVVQHAAQVSEADRLHAHEIERLKNEIEGLRLYVSHDISCRANDFDYLDHTPCTCGLRRYYSPKGIQP